MRRSIRSSEVSPRGTIRVGLVSALAVLSGSAATVSAGGAARPLLPRTVQANAVALTPLDFARTAAPHAIAAKGQGEGPRSFAAPAPQRSDRAPAAVADAATLRVELAAVPLIAIAPPLGQASPPAARVVAAPAATPAGAAQIEQIPGSLTVGELALAAGGRGADLPARIAAMQVPLPAALAAGREDRAALLATAPEQLTVRVDGLVLGKVAVHSDAGGGFAVQLSGLLDVLADRFSPDDFERLRQSAGADSYVAFARLKDAGIDVHYDPAYDELTLGS